MIEFLKTVFAPAGQSAGDEEAASPHDIRVAACALFLEIANVDGEFSGQERDSIIALLENEYGLSDECAKELAKEAQAERAGSIDIWQFTNLINQNYSEAERLRILELVWTVVYADGHLAGHENYLMHKLAKLLRLTQDQMIATKLRASKKAKSEKR
jgi:uncharacterized tellurite resistance protein B-like protein